jgi:hypothetical protein
MRPTLFRYGFLKRNIDTASNLTARSMVVPFFVSPHL